MITASNDKVRLQFQNTFDGAEVRFSSTRTVPIINTPSQYKVCLENFTHFRGENPETNILTYRFYTNMPISGTLLEGQPNDTKQLVVEYQLNNYSDNLSQPYVSYMSQNNQYYDLYSAEPMYGSSLFVTKVDYQGVETPLTSGYFSATLLFEKK